MPPICVDCQLEMRAAKNGFVIELMAADQPYQKFSSDKFACPNCGFEVVVGVAIHPIAEHWQPGYAAEVADLQVWGSLKDQQTFAEVWCKDKIAENRRTMAAAAKAQRDTLAAQVATKHGGTL